jgi:glycosyltransferase involved in cell wall biosynthesis
MKIAYLINQYPQPSQTFIRREIAALEALGVNVERYTLRRWPGQLIDERDRAERDRTHAILDAGVVALIGASTLALFTRPARFLRAVMLALGSAWYSPRGLIYHWIYLAEACVLLRKLRHAADANGEPVRHLHVHFGTNATTVAMLCGALGGPSYSFVTHGPEEFDSPQALALGLKVRHAAFAVAISNFGRSQLLRWAEPRDWQKVYVVRCAVDESFLRAPVVPPPDDPRLVCVARFGETKGHLLLIDAAARLARESVPFQLTLIGDGPLRPQIEDAVRRHGVTDRVRLVGWRSNDEVREEMLRSRAVVLASFAEGLPVVFMEAFALGRPVVTSWVAGTPELVQHGVSGWLAAPGDTDGLVTAMRAALTAPLATLHEMGLAGRRVVEVRHHARTEASKLLARITSVVETRAAEAATQPPAAATVGGTSIASGP